MMSCSYGARRSVLDVEFTFVDGWMSTEYTRTYGPITPRGALGSPPRRPGHTRSHRIPTRPPHTRPRTSLVWSSGPFFLCESMCDSWRTHERTFVPPLVSCTVAGQLLLVFVRMAMINVAAHRGPHQLWGGYNAEFVSPGTTLRMLSQQVVVDCCCRQWTVTVCVAGAAE